MAEFSVWKVAHVVDRDFVSDSGKEINKRQLGNLVESRQDSVAATVFVSGLSEWIM